MHPADRLSALRAQVRRTVPSRPGVYLWLGRNGERLYIGKSRNLRARMLSYLTPGNLLPDARMRILVSAIEACEWRETAGELMALMLEDSLIKQHNPRHNDRQKDYRERRWLLLTDDPFPACLVVEEPGGMSGTVFGPFKDEYFARALRTLLTDTFGLRACTDPQPFRHSPRFDLGQCLAPCRGLVTPSDYGVVVGRVREFLQGDSAWANQRLGSQMTEASEHFQFERAAALRDQIEFCDRFAARQRFFNRFESAGFVTDEPMWGLRYEFSRGSLVRVTDRSGAAAEVPLELRQPVEDRRLLLDRANVVYGWRRAVGASR